MREVGRVAATLRRQFGLADQDSENELINRWNDAVGEDLAKQCRSVEFRNGALRVTVRDPAVGESLRWRERALIDEMNSSTERISISNIVIRISDN